MTPSETSEEYIARMKKIYTRTILPTPAYQFFIQYLEVIKTVGQEDLPPYMPGYSNEAIGYLTDFAERVSKAASQDINKELRLVEIEEDLIPLLESTDNKVFYRPLFFPTVFINNDFTFEEFLIKGLLIEDVPNEQDLFIYLLAFDKRTYETMTTIIILSAEETKLFYAPEEETIAQTQKFNNYIKNLVCNIIDMVEGNDEDLEVTTIVTTKEQNEKRVKRGKIPFPTKVFIRANKEFKKYIRDFNESDQECKETKISCKFLVRGHWMHFRSERYVRKRGEKTWVKPFYKGQGIVVAKPYKLIK